MTSYNVINNPVGAGDIVVADGKLTITGAPTMDYLKIGDASTQLTNAAVAQVYTVVTTAATNNTTYSIGVTQPIAELPNGFLQANINYTSDGSATTTEITNAFTALFNAYGFRATAVATNATTCTITADAGYELFTVTNTCSAPSFAVTSTVTGEYAINTYAVLAAQGIEGVTAGLTYTSVQIPYGSAVTPLFGIQRNADNVHTVYINDADAQYAAAIAAIIAGLSGLDSPGGDANPEAISHLD